MLESLRRAPTWRLHTKPCNFIATFYRITRVRNIAHPRNFGTLFIYYSSTIFRFLDSIYGMVSDFIFHLSNNYAYLRDLKPPILPFTSRKKSRLLFCFWDTFARTSVQMICFSIKLKTEWFDFFFSRMLFVRVLCKYHVKQNVLV